MVCEWGHWESNPELPVSSITGSLLLAPKLDLEPAGLEWPVFLSEANYH